MLGAGGTWINPAPIRERWAVMRTVPRPVRRDPRERADPVAGGAGFGAAGGGAERGAGAAGAGAAVRVGVGTGAGAGFGGSWRGTNLPPQVSQ
jgi:hypothetical protein